MICNWVINKITNYTIKKCVVHCVKHCVKYYKYSYQIELLEKYNKEYPMFCTSKLIFATNF